jgi:hypothetical protein
MLSLPCKGGNVSKLINTQRGRYTQGLGPSVGFLSLNERLFSYATRNVLGSTDSMVDLNSDTFSDNQYYNPKCQTIRQIV